MVPVNQLANLLNAYVAARPYMFIDKLSISSPEGNPEANKQPLLLHAVLDVSSYLRPTS
jgi:hypothetical protein